VKLSYTRIITDDVPALTAFYEALLGAQADFAPETREDYVQIETDGGATLAICSHRTVERYAPGMTEPCVNQSVIFDIQVDDVDREHQRLQPLVSDWVLSPTNQPWGNRATLLRDPDGNIVNLFAPIEGHGR
jgi:predicted enzyme related to lactoylglutathione lyase